MGKLSSFRLQRTSQGAVSAPRAHREERSLTGAHEPSRYRVVLGIGWPWPTRTAASRWSPHRSRLGVPMGFPRTGRDAVTAGADLLLWTDASTSPEVTLVLLALASASVIGFVWWKHPSQRLRAAVASIGVVLAYLASEGLKVLFAQPRPCSRWVTAAECPPAGDWSLPSNHATLAFGAAAVVAVLLGRAAITWAMVGFAVLVAIGRVLEGVHYVHDVAIGALLGMAIPVLLTLAFDAFRGHRVASRRTGNAGDPLTQ